MTVGADLPVSSTLLTDFRFGWLHYKFIEAKFDGQTPIMTTLGWNGLNSLTDNAGGESAVYFNGNDNVGMTSWGTSNGGGLHCNCPLNEDENEYQIVNNWTREMGRHSIKFGADVGVMTELRIASDDNRTGEFTYLSQQSSNPTAAVTGGVAFASYLFGSPNSMVRYYGTSLDAEETPKSPLLLRPGHMARNAETYLQPGRALGDLHAGARKQGGEWRFLELSNRYDPGFRRRRGKYVRRRGE